MKTTLRFRPFSLLLAVLLILFSAPVLLAQQIKTEISLKTTPVKNQANSGTCWSFSVVSMIESELLRTGKGQYDLSEMYIVHHAYPAKADRYLRLGGKASFGAGGQGHDVFDMMIQYGMVPEEAYSGLLKGKEKHDHMEMDKVLTEQMKSAVTAGEKATPGSHWRTAIDSILNAYLGEIPKTFEYKGKEYTPESFAASLGINPGDYIELTSYSHHPFYQSFVLEVPDNWAQGRYYNVPLEDLMRVMKNSLAQGYTFAWDGDVSGDVSFSRNEGIARLSDDSTRVTQDVRQAAFDEFITTDDHLMHISGLGKDEKGNTYFLTKNSWGENKGDKGYWWLSENYVRMNTIAIVIHKSALPADLRLKLGL